MAVAKPKHEYDIHETPGVCGGYPCVGNTRIPVRTIVTRYRATGSVASVAEALPQLTIAQIEEALAYYGEFSARVDEDIETNARAWEELRSRPQPLPLR